VLCKFGWSWLQVFEWALCMAGCGGSGAICNNTMAVPLTLDALDYFTRHEFRTTLGRHLHKLAGTFR